MSRRYETVYVVNGRVEEDSLNNLIEEINSLLANEGAEVALCQNMGRRKMAYPIQKVEEGYYVLLQYTADQQVIARLENALRIKEPVLRFLTTVRSAA